MARKFWADEDGNACNKKESRGPAKLNAFRLRERIPVTYFESDADLLAVGGLGHSMIFDIECYPNYFLIGFMHLESGRYVDFEIRNDDRSRFDLQKLEWLIWKFRLIGFNSAKYDILMLMLSLRGYPCERLKEYSNRIVGNKDEGIQGLTPYFACKEFGIRIPDIDHIDLIEVCPLSGSLKLYGARLHAQRIQELPFEHNDMLESWQMDYLANYCLGSDIPATKLIFGELTEQIKLRYELSSTYKTDLRSKSDAQIAEAVFAEEIKRITGRKVADHNIASGAEFGYRVPDYIQFQTPMLQRVLRDIAGAKFKTDNAGSPMWPAGLGVLEKDKNGKDKWVLKVSIAGNVYTIGMGGLHSNEKCAAHRADENYELHDDDVESYYPNIILNQKLYPKHIGDIFLDIYEKIVKQRVGAKNMSSAAEKAGDRESEIRYKIISDSLKIVINGLFGKLGSYFSDVYAPDLMLQVTITGQLCLLMLIEMFELNGISVTSANTDGVVTKVPKNLLQRKEQIIKAWEAHTGFKTERTNYSATYNRDVNNYIAVKTPDEKTKKVKLKFKGAYLNPWADKKLAIFRFHKNPRTTICIEAVESYIIDNVPLHKTILACKDVSKFIAVQNVKGGAHIQGDYLGKVARWYYACGDKATINRIETDNKVNETLGAKPLMDMPDKVPHDLDYDWYIEKANTILYDIGFHKKPGYTGLFDDDD